MSETPRTKAKEMIMDVIAVFVDRYGPSSFHLASLLALWLLIMQPELERNRITFSEQQQIVKQMQDIVAARTAMAETYLQGGRSQEAAAITVLQATTVLEGTAKRLEAITETVLRQSKRQDDEARTRAASQSNEISKG